MQNQAIIPTSTKRSYKSAGTHWITTIPTDWRMQRVKSLLGERNERGHPSEPLLAATQSQGVVLKEKYDSRTVLPSNEVDQFKLVREGDFVISLRSFQGGIEYTYDQGIISPAYTVIYPYNPLTRDYFARLFKSRPFVQNLATCVTGIREGQNIDYTRLQVQTIPVPPPDEQAAIVRFLDHADEQIQAYISAKQRLIALLEEERQALVHQAVTRGLDPNVKLKPSGVEWLGDVPEHWVTCRIKQVSGILRGKFTHRPRNDPSLYDGPYPFIQTGDIASTNKILSGYNQTLNENGFAVSKMFPKGTLVMTIAANIGDVAVLDFDACFPDSVVGFVPTVRVDRDYLYYLFLAMKNELLREAPVNTQGNLNVDRIGSSTIALPQKEEQTNIVNHVERSVSNIDAAIDRSRRQTALMEEYRTRLIADVVTGQLDVREAAEELPTPEPTEITD